MSAAVLVIAASLLSFFLGLGIGVFLVPRPAISWINQHLPAEAPHIGHTEHVSRAPRTRRALSPTVGVFLVAIALMSSTITGVMLLTTRSDLSDLVECSVDFNQKTAEANTARDDAAKKATQSSKKLWNTFIRLSENPPTEDAAAQARLRQVFIDAMKGYVDRLDYLTITRQQKPYPPPDYCQNGGEWDKQHS